MNRSIPQDLSPELLACLEERGARFLPTLEGLQRNQAAMLATFARGGVARARWQHLVACNGHGCPNAVCSEACWFGERVAYLQLVTQAHDLLVWAEAPLWFVTAYDPRYRRGPGELSTLPLDGVRQGLRRRLQKLEREWGPIQAFGGIEASFEVERDGSSYWGPHTHQVVVTHCPPQVLRLGLLPASALDPGSRPVVIKPVTNLANLLSYCLKRQPAERAAFLGTRGTQDRAKHSVSASLKLEYDLWLLSLRPTTRLILRGLRRVHDRLVPLRSGRP